MPEGPGPSRRAVLGGTALVVLPALCGCSGGEPARAPAPGPDVALLTGAIAAEQDLIGRYEAARGAHASLAGQIDPALAHHREHVAVLRRHYVPGSGRQADGSPAPTVPSVPQAPSPQQAPGRASSALADLRAAEGRTAARHAADAGRAGAGLAQLLAAMGVCAAGHAGTSGTAAGRTGAQGSQPPASPAPSPSASPSSASPSSPAAVTPPSRASTLPALQAALAAEHVAVYGYGVLGSRLTGSPHQAAQEHWNVHRDGRDTLTALLTARGARPVAASAAYRLPVRVTSARTAAQLAARLEDDLILAYVRLAGGDTPQLRSQACRSAQDAMVRAVRWRTSGGLPLTHAAFPGLPSSSLPPRPTPGL
ncbi:ferritin-like domain-containing protein [Spirillospora sp. NPDC047279]|uniref:ferritin-like domain-containing protein n=1 Tax=Spirillospora sp. NPDC047279 TaxID=3155478 RepID=UPI0033D24CC4